MTETRDHGGGLDAAIARYGGTRDDWLDLSTGINPVPYPVGEINANAWTALPDRNAFDALERAARAFWSIPQDAAIIAAPGASSLIARMPELFDGSTVTIPAPTYNEHAAAFHAQGWKVQNAGGGNLQVLVHPNNPDGRSWSARDLTGPAIIDESFCDVAPQDTLVDQSAKPDRVVLKSFGKFWGLAGLRLGFAIAAPTTVARLAEALGPWAVSGPALQIGAQALQDVAWAEQTRARLATDAARLDRLMLSAGAHIEGGTTLFRLYRVDDAANWQLRLASNRVWSRVFPYSDNWLRLGLPAPDRWAQLEAAL